jgi:hypothetical protein
MRGLKKFKLSVAFEVHLPAELPQSRATLRAPRPSNGMREKPERGGTKGQRGHGGFEGYHRHRKPSN